MADDPADRIHREREPVDGRDGRRAALAASAARGMTAGPDKAPLSRARRNATDERNGTVEKGYGVHYSRGKMASSPLPVSRGQLIAVGLTSGTLLMTELALTRIFSVVMYYHFAFLAISIALFGLSASGVFAYVARRRLDRQPTDTLLAWQSVIYAVFTLDCAVRARTPAGRPQLLARRTSS